MDTTKILIQINNASFKYPGEEYLFNDLKLTLKEGDKIALVGANGSGKSTILQILTGAIKLEEGSQIVDCRSHYVPQIDLTINQKNLKIHEYIQAYYEEWWDVLTKLEKLFDLKLNAEAEAKTLSGGELMKLNLAIAIKHNPNVLVLDEPTNHLDVRSLNALIKFINVDTKGKYTYVIVSHDIFFLDNVVTTIWELENKNITAYGGNYTFYKKQKALHLRGIKKQYELAREKLERSDKLEQKETEKRAKKAGEAKRAFIKGSIDKEAYSLGKSAASSLQRGKANVVERLKEEAEEKLEEFETEERKLAFINMINTSENVNRTIFEVKEGVLSVGKNILIKKLNLKVTYGDRVLISGDNGSGKTTLIKALIGEKEKTENVELNGEIYTGSNLAWVYIDQNYSLIKPGLTLTQNLMNYNKLITDSKAKEQLGKFQFKTELEMNKMGSALSGGEMVRLIMAMISSFPIDLIILDEPTNNLDVETVEVLVKSLNLFRGAVIVISHNMDFIFKIGIKTAYLIKNKSLKEIGINPNHKESFYKSIAE